MAHINNKLSSNAISPIPTVQSLQKKRVNLQQQLPQLQKVDTFTEAKGIQGLKQAKSLTQILQQRIDTDGFVRLGQSGDTVQEMQQLLNRVGMKPALQIDGMFGPRTDAALRKFQTENNIKVDGIFGPQSLQALQNSLGQDDSNNTPKEKQKPPQSLKNILSQHAALVADLEDDEEEDLHKSPIRNVKKMPVNHSPKPMMVSTVQYPRIAKRKSKAVIPNISIDEKILVAKNFAPEKGRVAGAFGATRNEREQQAEIILQSNEQWPPQEGRAYVIQIDQDPPSGNIPRKERNAYVRNYTGQSSVFRVQDGHLIEQNTNGPYRSAAHPGQYNTISAPDVNNDKTSDIAHVRSGVYQYKTQPRGERYDPINNHQFEVARDTNHNGVIDGNEKNGKYEASGIQIHAGHEHAPVSIGCQTLPPSDYAHFQNAIRDANTSNYDDFTYILVRRPNDIHGENRF